MYLCMCLFTKICGKSNIPTEIQQVIDYLKKGLGTAMLGVWNLGPSMKMGVYFKNSL